MDTVVRGPSPENEERRLLRAEQDLETAYFRALRKAIFLAVGLYILIRFLGAVTFLLLYFGLVMLIAAVLNPVVAWLHRHKIPRPLGAIGLILALIGILVGAGFLVIPQLITQLQQFVGNLPQLWDHLRGRIEVYLVHHPQLQARLPTGGELLQRVEPYISGLLGRLSGYAFTVGEAVVLVILMVMLLIYSLARPEPLVTGLLGAVPEPGRPRAEEILGRVLARMKSWALGTIELAVILGILSWVGLHFLGVPYAFVFAVIAALGELVPTLGPLITAVPPLVTALAISPMLAVWVAVLYLALHQIENHLLVPLVMGGAVDLHPVSVTFAVLVMATLFGLIGIIIAVPTALILKTLYQELYLSRLGENPAALKARSERVIAEESAPDSAASTEGQRFQGGR